MQRRGSIAVKISLAVLLAFGLTACGSDDEGSDTGAQSGGDGSDTVQIEYVDYGYKVSGPLTAGGTIEFTNAGKEVHMMFLGKLKAGKTLAEVQELLAQMGGEEQGGEGGGDPAVDTTGPSQPDTTAAEAAGGEDENPLVDVMDEIGIPWNLMTPGASAAVTAPDLAPGDYAMICFLPTEGTGEPHFAKGMVNQLEVVEGDVAEPKADVTYKIAAGKAPDGPANLTAGEHTVKFEKVGDGDELEPSIGKLDTGKTFVEVDAAFESLFGGEEPPPKGSGEGLPADVFIGGDFLTEKSFYVTMEFVPGKYVIVAEDSEDEEDVSPPKELLDVTMT
ncbi:MAG: hypothetical protein QOG87_1459 [Actinomycetota bacterium]|jgi:hypothetical protein